MPPREEKIINGVWHWRYTDQKEWTPMSPGMMTEWIRDLKGDIDKLRRQLMKNDIGSFFISKKLSKLVYLCNFDEGIPIWTDNYENRKIYNNLPECMFDGSKITGTTLIHNNEFDCVIMILNTKQK